VSLIGHVGDCFATSYIPNHICMDLVAVSRRRGNLARTGLQRKQVRIVNSEYVQEELASVLKEFTKRDYAWLSSSLERVREGLLDRCQTAGERGFVWLAFHLHAIALADLKGVPLERTVSMVDAAFAHIAADPAHRCGSRGLRGSLSRRRENRTGSRSLEKGHRVHGFGAVLG
jgi:hypothetical protein